LLSKTWFVPDDYSLKEEPLKEFSPEQQAKIEEAVAKMIREYLKAHNGLPAQTRQNKLVMWLV